MRLIRSAAVFLAPVLLVVILGARLSSAAAKDEKELRGSVDTIVKDAVANHHISSMVVAVLQNGKTVYQKAYGTDPLFPYAENAPSNPYAIGPMTQVLTGVAVLSLVDEGKLSLDDPVSRYLPDLPETWRPITIGQLLTHRSGLPAFPREAKSFAEAVEEAGKQPLRFRPGSVRSENSADYDVLGQVIEKVSGQKYLFFMDKTVFKQMKFGATGDFSMLLFRFVKPHDFRFSDTMSTQGAVTTSSGASVGTLTEKGGYGNYDPEARARMVDLLSRGLPAYAIPSRGLASNLQDIERISSAIFATGGVRAFSGPDYLKLAPGWKGCDTGAETMLTAGGRATSGYGANVRLLPNRKVAVILLWKIDKGSDSSALSEESQDILETALSIPVSSWVCTEAETDEDNSDPQ